MDRSRRRLLGAVALLAGAAGCTGAPEDSNGSPTPAGGTTPGEPADGSTPTGTAADLDLREANVTGVDATETDGGYRFDVTLYHDDDGEDGYADWWQVETLDGDRLGRRDLAHPHGTSEFTRSTTVEVPDDVACVVVRGHDRTHGYGGRAMLVTLASGATRTVAQGPEPDRFAGATCPQPVYPRSCPKYRFLPHQIHTYQRVEGRRRGREGMTEVIDGDAVAGELRADLAGAIEQLRDAGVAPTLATVLMSPDPASETYVSMKQRDCEEVGIDARDVELPADAPAEDLYGTIDELNDDEAVHGVLVQMPVPDHVDDRTVLERVDPAKDVDGFHPENVGRLVAGNPRFKPCTPHGIQQLLDAAGVDPEGKDVTIVGRSNIVGKPLANLLLQKAPGANATVTVCHSRTADLAAKTRDADVVVAACGVPELIDGSMLSDGAVVVDVGVNRVDADTEKGYELVGDVDFESAKEVASAITPVPGGVGPMTRAMLLYNTVKAASEQSGVDVDLP